MNAAPPRVGVPDVHVQARLRAPRAQEQGLILVTVRAQLEQLQDTIMS
jgi:hypothetical protein